MTRIIVIVGFIVAYSAGLMMGVSWKGHAPAESGRNDNPRDRGSWLVEQLSLTSDQQKQMKEIWSNMGPQHGGPDNRGPDKNNPNQGGPDKGNMGGNNMGPGGPGQGGPDRGFGRRSFHKDQEDAIAKLIHQEDRAAYDAIIKQFKDKQDAMEAEGRKAFQQAVEKTKAILTPEQREKYDLILARHGPDARDKDRPTSRPSGQ